MSELSQRRRLLMLSGSTADRLGRRRTFQTGLLLFTVGSLLCSLAPSLGWLIAFRMAQAVGGSMLNPVAMYVPESRASRARRVDVFGQLQVIVLLASLTYAIIDAPRAGWASPTTIGLLVLALCALGGLLAYERRRLDPLIELRFFRSVTFSGVTVIAVSDVRGLSAIRAGLCTLPLAMTTLIFAPLSGRLVGARGPRIPLLSAGVAMCAGSLTLVELRADTALVWVLAGVAAAVASTSRQVGTALGVAMVGSVLSSGLAGPMRTGFAMASHPAWWIVAGCGLAVLGLGALTSGQWAEASAERTARLFEEDEELARAAA